MKTVNEPNIAIILFPWASSTPYKFTSTIIGIIEPITPNIYLITVKKKLFIKNPNLKVLNIYLKVHYAKTKTPIWYSYTLWILKFILIEIYTSIQLIRILKKIDTVIFMSYPFDLLPLLITKIFKKKIITPAMGSPSINYKKTSKKTFFSLIIYNFLKLSETLTFRLSDLIIVQSRNVINFIGLDKYRSKVRCSGDYLDTNIFEIKKQLKDRNNLIGYIGRLAEGKGLIELVNSMNMILEEFNDAKFLIGGTGSLENEIQCEIENMGLDNSVEIPGWIPPDRFVDYLNRLKLYVFPSDSEGLPIGILEAMACGTPVLATSVGGIPDVIKDGETGFILENNSPECIAKNVVRALKHPHLDEIVANAREKIEKEYKFDNVVENYKKFLIDD